MFKVGDKVFSCQFGWGKISKVDKYTEHPLYVNFGNDVEHAYTKCGRYFDTDLQPTLSFTEYDLVNGGFSQERPKKEMVGKLVRILDDNDWEGFIGILDRITPLGKFEVNNIEFENVELYEKR